MFVLPDRPETCNFLTQDEKSIVVRNLGKVVEVEDPHHISWSEFFDVFKSWKVWLFCLLSLGNNSIGAVVSFFIPSIINQFGFDPLTSNLLSAPPFFCGVLCILLVTNLSDRLQERPLHLLIPFSIQIIGWLLVGLSFYYDIHLAGQYLALCVTVGVHYTFTPIFWAWLTQELQGGTTTAISTAVVASFGTFAQIYTPPLTTLVRGKTGSYMFVTLALSAFGFFGTYNRYNIDVIVKKE